eukprot:4926476-Pleurochrysis_carterae.AAC.1
MPHRQVIPTSSFLMHGNQTANLKNYATSGMIVWRKQFYLRLISFLHGARHFSRHRGATTLSDAT